jgi:hypothetical protein
MTDDDDLFEVPEHLVPFELVDAVFDGRASGDLADGVAAVAELVGAARRAPSAAERSVADAAVAAFVAVIAAHPIASTARSPRMIARLITAKTAAIAVATLCTAGAAAAATGTLPPPAQHAVTRAANAVGFGAPASKHDDQGAAGRDDEVADTDATTTSTGATTTTTAASTTTSSTSTTSTSTTTAPTTTSSDSHDADADDAMKDTPVGPDVTGPAKKGLCNAYLTSKAKGHLKNPDAIAFRNLLDAAAAVGKSVEDFCADVTSTPLSVATTAAAAPSSSGPATSHGTPAQTHGNNGNGNGKGKG